MGKKNGNKPPRYTPEELKNTLESGVRGIMDSERFKEFLSTFGRFHNYSWRNKLLILMQKPDATLCASFSDWKKLGRYPVGKGKGLAIWRPNTAKVVDVDEDGNEEEKTMIFGFSVAYTFDVSDTDGKELPTLADPLVADVDNYMEIFQILRDFANIPVMFTDDLGQADGCYYPLIRQIKIKSGMSEAKTISTLVHEIAHSILHNDVIDVDRHLEECQAESIAFAVSNYLGIESSTQSFSYLATWSKGRELKEIESSIDIIYTTARDIINTLEKGI